jgi:hypothetical protein
MQELPVEGKPLECDVPNFHHNFLEHTKCPPSFLQNVRCSSEAGTEGFFRFGDLQLYGRINGGASSSEFQETLSSIEVFGSHRNTPIMLPFDPGEIIDNLRLERYVSAANAEIPYIANDKAISRRVYYGLRPFFPVYFRRILQRYALRDWQRISFPAWPLDTTVDDFIRCLWIILLKVTGAEQIPFIWYWPEGFQSCAIMTHDVETAAGLEFCETILKLEREAGIRSAFELVPEVRYAIPPRAFETIRREGGEICIHGLNHDGKLFSSEEVFRKRARAINEYAKKWGAKGFRSPIMYRNLAWYDAFNLSYDMSVPNVAHLDPQRGGCCTIFPFFVQGMVELPLTTIQDYPLYNIIRSDPMTMWTRQMDSIAAKHGLVSFIIHPDYTIERSRQDVYRELLRTLRRYGVEKNMWLALPGEVDTWWRQRNSMTLQWEDGGWSVRGEGSERAIVAYAKVENGKLKYVLPKGTRETAVAGHSQ